MSVLEALIRAMSLFVKHLSSIMVSTLVVFYLILYPNAVKSFLLPGSVAIIIVGDVRRLECQGRQCSVENV